MAGMAVGTERHGVHFHCLLHSQVLLRSSAVNSFACAVCVLSRSSRVQLFESPWTVALQAPLSMGFSRQEYWSGLPFPPPGDLPDSGIKTAPPVTLALAGGF